MGGAFHDGLCSFELYFGIETFNKRIIPAAGKTVAELSNAHSLVTLDVKTAGDVEGVDLLIVFQNLGLSPLCSSDLLVCLTNHNPNYHQT